MKKNLIIFICLLFYLASTKAQTIRVAAIDWCPQICINEVQAGYTVDLINKVYQDSQYALKIDVFPWSRAIKYVSEGKYDALLSPAKKEAPHLVFPRYPVGQQTMCFFTSVNNSWQFKDESSLSNMRIGIAVDTSIEELNQYLAAHPEQFQYQPYHERYVVQSAMKVMKGRIDAFLFTKNTTLHELKKADMLGSIKNAGCVSKADIYLAFTPTSEKAVEINQAVQFFDQRMSQLIKTGYVNKLLQQYDIN